jgi:hypothetical protein
MDCPNCGAYNASNSFRCRRCGHVLQPDAEETELSGFGESPEPGADDASWQPADESVEGWGAGQRDEPEPASNPWSYSEPGAAQSHEGWSAGQPSGSIGSGSLGDPEFGPGFGPPPDIPNYLWQSIAVTLCCCWPVGIPAIVFAARVNAFVASGNYTGAREASQRARNWVLAAFIAGLVFYLGFICLMFAGG